MEISSREINFQTKVEPKIEPNIAIVTNIEAGGKSIAAEHHQKNEDSFFYNETKTVFGIFDGVGGEANGDLASNLSCESIKNSLFNISPNISTSEAKVTLDIAFYQANEKVLLEAKKQQKKMGSTGTFGIICQDKITGNHQAVICNIGDSRAYRFRDDKLEPITLDNGTLQVRYKDRARFYQDKFSNLTSLEGLSFEEKEAFVHRNGISKFFGFENSTEPDFYTVDLKAGDRLLLCTDGVHDNLTDQEISAVLSKNNDPNSIVDILIDKSIKRSHDHSIRSKSDDTTAIVIDFKNDSSEVFTPIIGNSITVQRSSGAIEPNWSIINIRGDNIVVRKKEGEYGVLDKTIPIKDVERFNRPAKIEDITTSKNRNQLIFTINKLGGIKGSDRYYPSDELIFIINEIFKGKIPIGSLTRSGNLRNTVLSLMEK